MTIEQVNQKCFNRLAKEITKSGPLDWGQARLAMWGGHYDRRDAQSHNRTLKQWIDEGKLINEYDGYGDCKINLPK